MKKVIIKSAVFILTFFLTMVIAGRFMNRGNNDMTMKMGTATLPVVVFWQDDVAVNEAHGHVEKMDVSSMASDIIQLGDHREISFSVQKYNSTIGDILLEVRSCDGSRLIEQSQITDYEDLGDSIRVDTVLKDLLEEDTEYAVVVVLTDGYNREIRYYTRCVWGTEVYAAEKAAFVKDFYETTFDKEAARELVKYLESNSSGDNTTLHKVDIHSSFSQVTWGELGVTPASEPMIHILDLGKDTGCFTLESLVSAGSGEEQELYAVEEFYRIRYTKDRVYLLDFERTMTRLPEVEEDIYANDKIMLGIAGSDIQLEESTDGNYLAFVAYGRVCTYSVKSNKIALLYSFYDAENMDARTLYLGHDMKILSVDDTGNVKFAVYGYFNRGKHEGETGVGIFSFDSAMNTVEEMAFIPYDKSWEVLQCDVEKLLYLNDNDKLYVFLNQGMHEVDLIEKTDNVLIQMKDDTSMHVSQNHQIVLWNQGDRLQVLNLETEKQTEIQAGSAESMQALGFMEDDIIYGILKDEDIVEDSSGRDIRPMYRVVICDSEGRVQKTYEEEDIYTTSIEIVDNQITLNRVKKNENGSYTDTVPEHIVNNEEQTVGKNKLVMAVIDVYETVTQIQVKSTINDKTLQVLTPKEVIFEGEREIIMAEEADEKEATEKLYYVYNRNGVDEISSDAAPAISLAYETSGRVVDETGQTVWFKGNRVTRNQIMAITQPEKVSGEESLAACLDTILKFEGITAQTAAMLEEGMDALEILQSQLVNAEVVDLMGCTMDAMLYFVNRDIPVLALLSDGEAVLITGFNEYNIVAFEPAEGKLGKKGMNDSTKWFAENGNHFITYFEKE